MNPQRFTYSSQKAEIISSVLSGTPIKEVALNFKLSTSRVQSIVNQAARRWQKEHNLNFDLSLVTLRTYSKEINEFVLSYSPETIEDKNIRVADRKLRTLQARLLTIQNQIKQLQNTIKDKQHKEVIINNLIEEAQNELKEAHEIAMLPKCSK